MASIDAGGRRPHPTMTREEKKVILASSAGTSSNGTTSTFTARSRDHRRAVLHAVPRGHAQRLRALAFAAGFIVRPFGALVFGCLATHRPEVHLLMTILIMGVSTFLVGLLPNYYMGRRAPVILIILRMLQGLALGGEYGGAAIYVAEHAPQNRRGYYTAFIQTTATLGLLLSLIVILTVTSIVNNNFDPVPILDAAGAPVLGPDGVATTRTAFRTGAGASRSSCRSSCSASRSISGSR
jgi:MFS family permease